MLDSGTTLGTVLINESILVTQSQGGLAQGSYGGVGWLGLGAFTTTDGNLEVLLSNRTSSGSFVDADGVLLVPDGPAVMVGSPAPSPGAGAIVNPSMGTIPVVGTPTGPATTPTVSIGSVTQPTALTVVYNSAPPARATRPRSASSTWPSAP